MLTVKIFRNDNSFFIIEAKSVAFAKDGTLETLDEDYTEINYPPLAELSHAYVMNRQGATIHKHKFYCAKERQSLADGHQSDCAVNNGPGQEPGACDCGKA